ncbi:MAG: 2Fe-2S iron-sulfur cluster-binding protein [Spirochaetota bacterium]
MINFMPLVLMNTILLVITLLLAVANRLLVTYGACKLQVKQGDDVKEFSIQGGGNLLSALIDNSIKISSSCGGKGSCGYCKVRVVKGGGQILPTEEIYMSRQEKYENMRLACQVKVKNDIEIIIPDYLTIVRQMVLHKKFDPNKRWLVKVQ